MDTLETILNMVFWTFISAFVAQAAHISAKRVLKWMGERATKSKADDKAEEPPVPAPSSAPPSPTSSLPATSPGYDPAAEAMLLLAQLHQQPQPTQAMSPVDGVNVTTPRRTYTVTTKLAEGDLCHVYQCVFVEGNRQVNGVFKVARDALDNDLVENEAQTLRHLRSIDRAAEFQMFLPTLEESFTYRDATSPQPRQVNILSMHPDIPSPTTLYSLKEVRQHYAIGIDPKDMAWMWRRLLSVLGFAHECGVIHSAVLPPHVLIEPVEHKLLLIDWSYAVQQTSGQPIGAISTTYEDWYPHEVFQKQPPLPGLDIHMAAQSMLYLLGLDPPFDANTANMEPALQRYFDRCLHREPSTRPQDAWRLLEDFDTLIETLWGPRTFRPFSMPAKG